MIPTRRIHRGGDQFTECAVHGIGLDPTDTPLHASVLANRPLALDPSVQDQPCEMLYAALRDPASVQWDALGRYWSGYRVYLVPLTAALPLEQVRFVNAILLVAAPAAFAFASARAIGSLAAIALIMPMLVLTDLWQVWRVTPHTVSVVWTFLGAALFAACVRRGVSHMGLIVVAALAGSVYAFVDVLTSPPWQPMMLMFLVLAFNPTRQSLLAAALVAAAWFGGYGLTWASKWPLVAMVEGSSISETVLQSPGQVGGRRRQSWIFPS